MNHFSPISVNNSMPKLGIMFDITISMAVLPFPDPDAPSLVIVLNLGHKKLFFSFTLVLHYRFPWKVSFPTASQEGWLQSSLIEVIMQQNHMAVIFFVAV